MGYTINDLRMDYHRETGTNAKFYENELFYDGEGEVALEDKGIVNVDIEYFSWVEEEAARLRGENKELMAIVTKLTK